MQSCRASEVAAYTIEAAAVLAYARRIHLLNHQHEPDWTWLAVTVGIVISGAPTIVLARIAPADWRRYERRALAGFLVSAAIIVPWQLWLFAVHEGERRGYKWGSSDQTTPLVREP